MHILVLVKMVPDLVEELTIDPRGVALDTTWLRFKLNEFDDHAIEQAILIKEALVKEGISCQVTVAAPDIEGCEDALFTAAAKGADRLVKLLADFEAGFNNHALAKACQGLITGLAPDLIFTGVQAHDDLDGSLGALIAGYNDWPYVGYIAGAAIDNGAITVRKEFPGGVLAEMLVRYPAVLGIQASETPPRYIAFSRIRQAMKEAPLEELDLEQLDPAGGGVISSMAPVETGEKAEMFSGSPEQIAAQMLEILQHAGIV